ncbi:MAG TPA: anaerobic ribonucleoside-triphosphate reductase [Conexivisphaerales archaeon]|nr:anaerobic ribonucleoside-triphosphate reductase [Conexivisphaerales archaeon]
MSTQVSIRRVKTIFSVIASPSRLEILKILNAKGPMTYSELKTLAGFKSKKESGKFAYHLRKLLRQNLIAQNRAERKYMLTTLGRLVLNAAKQIEEQALLESGRLFVRSSRHRMEEFTTDKIVHSLVTEAGMPVELAQRVSSEAESRIYKFQTAYLTAPLIRELVNSILIEEGLEEYRHRLSRLGMPVYDVTENLEKLGEGPYGLEAVHSQTAGSVLSEYLMLIQLPRDVVDSHLSGDIHIANVNYWGLRPDALFINVSDQSLSLARLGAKFPHTPREGYGNTDHEDLTKLLSLSYLLTREAGREVFYTGFADMASKLDLGARGHSSFFYLMAYAFPEGAERPKVEFEVDASKVGGALLSSLLKGYLDYTKVTPSPSIGLAIVNSEKLEKPAYKLLAEISRNNGVLSFSKGGASRRTFQGLRVDDFKKGGPVVLDSISINLPRIALDAHNDDVYFRARVTMQLENAVNALRVRRRLIQNNIKNGLLPALDVLSNLLYSESPLLRVNLTGLEDSLKLVSPDSSAKELAELQEKTISSASQYLESAGKEGEEKFSLVLTTDDSSSRFPQLDVERFGRAKMKNLSASIYGQAFSIEPKELESEAIGDKLVDLDEKVVGGVLARLPLPVGDPIEAAKILEKANSRLPFFSVRPLVALCKKCGNKEVAGTERCSICGGATAAVQ